MDNRDTISYKPVETITIPRTHSPYENERLGFIRELIYQRVSDGVDPRKAAKEAVDIWEIIKP